MMTNVMAGSYPDVFAAASASAGVPFACFAGGNYTWNDDCAKGRITKTADEWKELVLAAYPGYTGPRPRMQLWHGANDDVLYPVNFDEAIKQWTGVLGVSQVPSTTETDTPLPDYTRTRYKDTAGTVLVEAVKGLNQPHNIQLSEEEVITFFGLDKTVALDHYRNETIPFGKPSVTVSGSLSGQYRISVHTRRGTIGAELYDCRGKKVAFPGKHCSTTGNAAFLFTATGTDHGSLSATVYILCVNVNGSVVYTARIPYWQ